MLNIKLEAQGNIIRRPPTVIMRYGRGRRHLSSIKELQQHPDNQWGVVGEAEDRLLVTLRWRESHWVESGEVWVGLITAGEAGPTFWSWSASRNASTGEWAESMDRWALGEGEDRWWGRVGVTSGSQRRWQWWGLWWTLPHTLTPWRTWRVEEVGEGAGKEQQKKEQEHNILDM